MNRITHTILKDLFFLSFFKNDLLENFETLRIDRSWCIEQNSHRMKVAEYYLLLDFEIRMDPNEIHFYLHIF